MPFTQLQFQIRYSYIFVLKLRFRICNLNSSLEVRRYKITGLLICKKNSTEMIKLIRLKGAPYNYNFPWIHSPFLYQIDCGNPGFLIYLASLHEYQPLNIRKCIAKWRGVQKSHFQLTKMQKKDTYKHMYRSNVSLKLSVSGYAYSNSLLGDKKLLVNRKLNLQKHLILID